MSRRKDTGERISDAEHAIMEVLWDKNPVSATDVCDVICDERDWSIATVKTILSRSDYVGGESRRLVDRLFGGRAAPLFAQLAESEALTDDDLAEIEALLREMRK